jgi:hypothetical protein
MIRTKSISSTPKESRRDRRYSLPVLSVVSGGDEYPTKDWSLGGFLLQAAPAVDVGGRIVGHLKIEGNDESFAFTAEAVRRDDEAHTLACRFIDPSPVMVDALDSAMAARFFGRKPQARRPTLGGLVAAALLLGMQHALAAATVTSVGVLVPGGAPPLEFHLNFPNLLSEPIGLPKPDDGDLQISLTSPDKSVLQFLFSPRSQFGVATDRDTGTTRSYAGLSWNLFDNGGFFGTLGFSGSMTRFAPEDINRRLLGPPFALHSTFEFGYQISDQHSLTLSLDHASTPDFLNDRNELNNFQLRYGLKF